MKRNSLFKIMFIISLMISLVSCSSKDEVEVRKTITTIIQAANTKDTELLLQTAPFLQNYGKPEIDAYSKLWRTITKNSYKIKNIKESSNPYQVQVITTNELGVKSDVYTFSVSKIENKFVLNENFEVEEPTIFIEYMDFSDSAKDSQ